MALLDLDELYAFLLFLGKCLPSSWKAPDHEEDDEDEDPFEKLKMRSLWDYETGSRYSWAAAE